MVGVRMSEGRVDWLWRKIAAGVVGAFAFVIVFTPWERHAPCPVRRGVPTPVRCDGPWTNILGWDFHGAFPIWVPLVAALLGFAVGWFVVSLVESLVRREKASALG
jgi:hypothetical protein